MPIPPAGMGVPPPAPAPAPQPAAAPKPALKPRPVAAPKPAAAAVPTKAAIPRPAAAPAPRPTVVRPAGANKDKEGEETTDATPAAEEVSPNESTIGAVIDVLALVAGIAGAVLLYLDYTAAAILF